jgi:hypothetical protein
MASIARVCNVGRGVPHDGVNAWDARRTPSLENLDCDIFDALWSQSSRQAAPFSPAAIKRQTKLLAHRFAPGVPTGTISHAYWHYLTRLLAPSHALTGAVSYACWHHASDSRFDKTASALGSRAIRWTADLESMPGLCFPAKATSTLRSERAQLYNTTGCTAALAS